jgi:protein-S-isoprenylcysteine O-methyltransferase Ste14
VGLLLVITGVLLLISGGVKARAATRAHMGVPLLSLLELFTGVAVSLLAMAGPAAAGAARLLVPLGVLLVVASSLIFSAQHRELRRRRSLTEAKRLESYVKYFSRADEIDPD